MVPTRDIDAFSARASRYDEGWLGQWHAQVVASAREIVARECPKANAIVDVGCGTGRPLAAIAADRTDKVILTGVDPSISVVERARSFTIDDERIHISHGAAEALPMPSSSVDAVGITTAFDHWSNQTAGLRECHRILHPKGRLIVLDLISPALWPTTVVGRRGRARTPRQINALLNEARFEERRWQRVSFLIRAVVARAGG